MSQACAGQGVAAGDLPPVLPPVVTTPGTVRLVEIAELLSVSKQRAHQLASEDGFPAPVTEDVRGRLWSPYEVQAWAKVWRQEKPWR